MTTSRHARRLLIAAALAHGLVIAPAVRGVIFYSTGDPTYNTSAPVGSLGYTAWNYQGDWVGFSGTPIAPQYFVTANHVGGSVGNGFTYNGRTYTTVPFEDGSANQRITTVIGGTTYNTDLVVWKIDGTFGTYAPLNSSSDVADPSTPAVIVGRGTQRGSVVTNGSGDPRGWNWGADDGVRRWGTNVISATNVAITDGVSTGLTIEIKFDANPAVRPTANAAGYSGANEAVISGGDSGGGIFVKNTSGTWKLAGINWALPLYSETSGGPAMAAALYDTRGYFSGTNQVGNQGTDVPQAAYASSISANYAALNGVIDNTWAWKVNADGNWGTSSNWWNATVATAPPNNADSEVVFGAAITAPRTVTLASNKTVRRVVFDGAVPYTLSGSSLTLDGSTTEVSIDVTSGSHTIATPLALNKNTTLRVGQPNSTLTISGALTAAAGTTLTKTGSGTVLVPNLRIPALSVGGGTVKIAANGTTSGTSRLTSLATTGGKLDLSDNDLVIDYTGSTPVDGVRQQLLSARGGGAWDGTAGLSSSSAASDPQQRTALGYGEASQILGPAGGTFSGQSVDGTSILVKYTWYGDANLDGRITSDDYALLDRGQTRGLTGWINGDFNYDNVVDSADYALIDRGYALQSGTLSAEMLSAREAQFGAAYVSALIASVPEPTSLAWAVAAVLPLARRRRR